MTPEATLLRATRIAQLWELVCKLAQEQSADAELLEALAEDQVEVLAALAHATAAVEALGYTVVPLRPTAAELQATTAAAQKQLDELSAIFAAA